MKKQLLSFLGLTLVASMANAQYCVDGGPDFTADTNLQGLVLDGETSSIDYSVTCPDIGGIIDSTGMVADLIAGSTYDVAVGWGTCSATTYGNDASVWIDFNGSLTFDAGELIGDYSVLFGDTYDTITYTFTVPTDALNGVHRMRVIQQEGGVLPLDPCASFNYGSVHDFSIDISGGVDCAPISEFSVEYLGTDSVAFEWSAGGGESSWLVEYGESGYTPGTGTSVVIDIFALNSFNDLMDNTDYDIYIKSICGEGDSSSYAGPFEFTTLCLALDGSSFCETFEDDSPTLSCWSVLDGNGDGDLWTLTNDNFGFYNGAASIYTDFNSGANDDWLISPNLTLTGNEALNFKYRVNSSFEPNDFEVLLSTTGTDPLDFTEVLIPLGSYDNTEYLSQGADLSAYDGDVYIAFHVPAGGDDGWYLYIDDVCVTICEPAPSEDGDMDICVTDSIIDLAAVITAGEDFGIWNYSENPGLIDGSSFDFSGLAEGVGSYELEYIVTTGCTADTAVATVTVVPTVNAGNDGVISICQNQPFDLLSALSGTVDLGGFWTNADGDELDNSIIYGLTEAGTFTYNYNATNGVCADDVAEIVVTVEDCDYLTLDESELGTVSVFPNPTTGLVNLTLAGSSEVFNVQVTDLTGRVILTKENLTNGTAQFDLNDQESGIYLVRVYNENAEQTIRVVRN